MSEWEKFSLPSLCVAAVSLSSLLSSVLGPVTVSPSSPLQPFTLPDISHDDGKSAVIR